MLDITLFRVEKGGNPDAVKASQRARYKDEGDVDKVIELDKKWRDARFIVDNLKKDFNKLTKVVGQKKKAKEDASNEIAEIAAVKQSIAEAEEEERSLAEQRDAILFEIGNLVHASVPVSDDEENNKVEKTFGMPRESTQECPLFNHVDLVSMLDIVNLESGSEVAGGRGYYLKRQGVLLNQALINYAMSFLVSRGYDPVQTPFFMKKDIMAECAQLSQFDEELYKVTGEGDDKYLIATSEQPLCSMFRKRWLEPKDLPQRIVGYSTCFRKEVGSHGRDTLGIFRVHQFEKIEQFCLTESDDSWSMQEEMLKNSEDFYQTLNIPYRVVNIVSGELNNAAARKFDLEAWFPASKTYRELVSCSNCTDYQSRRLDSRLRVGKGPVDQAKHYVHMLNSTLTATERTLCCILENYQTSNGVVVPEVLRPFMMGIEFIPFVKTLDKKGKATDIPGISRNMLDVSLQDKTKAPFSIIKKF